MTYENKTTLFAFFSQFIFFCSIYLIPDVNFENKLISLGIDSGVADGKVLTASISSRTSLDVSSSSITDLKGIQDFTALTYLICRFNQLATLDVSKNTVLRDLHCASNQLKSLDLTNNRFLESLTCYSNQLTNLNLKNGNNGILFYGDISIYNTDFKNNPNLPCIQVDDEAYANANWLGAKDATASYSSNCSLGIAESVFNTIAVYPNPTKGEVHIDNSILEQVTVYDVLGKLVKTVKYSNVSLNNTLDLSELLSGVYYVYLESEGTTIVKKIIVE